MLADITISPSIIAALIGLVSALVGIVILGGMVTGLGALAGLGATLIGIWNSIKPKTETFAEKAHVLEVERRLTAEILDHKKNNEHRSDELSREVSKLNATTHELRIAIAELSTRMEIIPPRGRPRKRPFPATL